MRGGMFLGVGSSRFTRLSCYGDTFNLGILGLTNMDLRFIKPKTGASAEALVTWASFIRSAELFALESAQGVWGGAGLCDTLSSVAICKTAIFCTDSAVKSLLRGSLKRGD